MVQIEGGKMREVQFNDNYYNRIILENQYERFGFQRIDFDIGQISIWDINQKWLCHQKADYFARNLSCMPSAVTTGIGLSGAPHIGTLSQIMRSIYLQKSGLFVQFVLGDFDSYNARNQSLSVLERRCQQYYEFICNLGFDVERGILRNQSSHEDVLKTLYLIANVLDDEDFTQAEEDLSELYRHEGIYKGIKFPVKMAILLMVADFIHLGTKMGYKNILIPLGMEEHMYVLLAQKVIKRMDLSIHIAALYSKIIKGLNGYPKMSKSILASSIRLNMDAKTIREKIMSQPNDYLTPDDSVVYQMISSVSYFNKNELLKIYEDAQSKDKAWEMDKLNYVDMLIDICQKWPADKEIDG